MSKKNAVKKFLKKHWISVWMTLSIATFSIIIASAAYTRLSSVKKVVSTQEGSEMMFSSNYLNKCEDENGSDAVQSFYRFSSDNFDENNPPIVEFNPPLEINNFALGDRSRHFNGDIEYKVTAFLCNQNGTALDLTDNDVQALLNGKTFQFGKKDETLTDLTQGSYESSVLVLSGARRVTDYFNIKFDGSQLIKPQIYIKVIAKPEHIGPNLKTLSAIIAVTFNQSLNVQWNGEFVYEEGKQPSDYDGFNYSIYGTGKAEITLTWNTDNIELNKMLDDLPEGTTIGNSSSEGWQQVVFIVDSLEQSQHNVQFYRKSGSNAINNWDDIKKSVTLDFKKVIEE